MRLRGGGGAGDAATRQERREREGGAGDLGAGCRGAPRRFFCSSRRRHTRYWRDWSSDVCSSDLGLSGTSAVLLGIILGLMMCFDLGGPVNKAAYLFATAGLASQTSGSLVIMATVMAAGMVPPLAMALSTAIRPALYTPAERDNGKAAWLLGASFISEGAIPFAAADPLRVIPSMMLGGATTGAIVAAAGVELRAPHGGIFVFFAITGLLWFVIGILAGTVVGAIAVTIAKSIGRPKAEAVPEDAVDMAHAHNAATPVTQPARA